MNISDEVLLWDKSYQEQVKPLLIERAYSQGYFQLTNVIFAMDEVMRSGEMGRVYRGLTLWASAKVLQERLKESVLEGRCGGNVNTMSADNAAEIFEGNLRNAVLQAQSSSGVPA